MPYCPEGVIAGAALLRAQSGGTTRGVVAPLGRAPAFLPVVGTTSGPAAGFRPPRSDTPAVKSRTEVRRAL
ncbi:hypothetical protein ACIODT_29320 [Streptomyces sp. NPDC088251]|uniref:hypothetical protein n=1 Tax=unclassified Streptomyces TaxID=2593676 RepID=UPI003823AEAF